MDMAKGLRKSILPTDPHCCHTRSSALTLGLEPVGSRRIRSRQPLIHRCISKLPPAAIDPHRNAFSINLPTTYRHLDLFDFCYVCSTDLANSSIKLPQSLLSGTIKNKEFSMGAEDNQVRYLCLTVHLDHRMTALFLELQLQLTSGGSYMDLVRLHHISQGSLLALNAR